MIELVQEHENLIQVQTLTPTLILRVFQKMAHGRTSI